MGAAVVLLALFLCALWGGVAPAIKVSLRGMPPVAIAAWRFLMALICILLFCWATRTSWQVPKRFHKALIPFSLIFVVQISVLNLGTQLTSSNHAVVLLNTNPLFVALLAHLLIPNDRLNLWKVSGLLLAFAGVYVIFREPVSAGAPDSPAGNVLALGSGFLLGGIQVYSKFLVRELSAVQLVVWEIIYGVPLFFAGSLLFEGNARYDLTPSVVAALFYQGTFVAAFCFVTWAHLMKRYAASKLSAFQFTVPIFGVTLSRAILGESVSPAFALGVALVAVGIYLVTLTSRPRLFSVCG